MEGGWVVVVELLGNFGFQPHSSSQSTYKYTSVSNMMAFLRILALCIAALSMAFADICPEGYFCTDGPYPCPAGYFCPEGTTYDPSAIDPTPAVNVCPDGKFS